MSKFIRILAGFVFVFAFAQATAAATRTVTKTVDTNDGICDADCSLREAVAAANTSVDNDVIEFARPLFDSWQLLTLSLGEIVITNNGSLTINGTGANKLTIDGNNASRIFSINGAVAFISDLRFTRGNGVGTADSGRGGAIYNNGGTATYTNLDISENTAANGGGTNHANTATTNYINCVISGNTTTGAGGGMQNFSGSTLTMINSTVFRNTSNSTLTGGGGILANGTLSFTNTTFSDNRVQGGSGGAIYYNGQGLTMNNVTISGNSATSATNAGGLHKGTSTLNTNVRNTIIAGNTGGSSPDVSGAIGSQGNNLIGTVGTSTGWVVSDITNQAALLSPLGNYGGMELTYALLSGSPAINGGNNCVVDLSCGTANPPFAVITDQRGASRPADTTVDIGAFEHSTSYRAVLRNAVLNQSYFSEIVPRLVLSEFSYSVSSGSLPPGLQLGIISPFSSDALGSGILDISGIPTQAGTFDFSLTATNGTNSAVINYRISVVGTTATLVGRVLTADGRPVRGAMVYISPPGGAPAGYSSSFGYFRIDGVATGASYQITATAKGYTIAPLTVMVTGNIEGFVLTASPGAAFGDDK